MLDLSSKTADADSKAAAHAEKVKGLSDELAGIEGRDADFGKTPQMKELEAQTKQLEAERKEHQERRSKAEERMKKAEEALATAKAKAPEVNGGLRRTFKRTGGPLVLGSISFTDVDTVREELTLCLGAGSTAGWVLVGYKDSKDDKNIVFQKSGMGGVEELGQQLRDNEIQYAIVRVNTSLASEAGATVRVNANPDTCCLLVSHCSKDFVTFSSTGAVLRSRSWRRAARSRTPSTSRRCCSQRRANCM